MKSSYDPVVDALYVALSEGMATTSEEVSPGIILDFDQDHRLVGIELLNAKSKLAADALASAAE